MMAIRSPKSARRAAALCLLLNGVVIGQIGPGAIAVKTVAEVEVVHIENGREVRTLKAADRVVPGDRVLYTLEVRNTGGAPVPAPMVTHAVPEHTRYVAGSAAGPGAEVFFSADGGRTFDRAESLAADPASYTHIRWQLKRALKANSVAFVRFRALVQ